MVAEKAFVSIIICTRNESLNLPACLATLSWATETFVVDSFSDDNTAELAREAGAIVIDHAWCGYADQKNWALENLPITTDWVLFLDADERVSPELAVEIREVLKSESAANGYFIPRRMIFLGRWLKRTWWYPDYNLRLFRRGFGRFEERSVHETVIVEGRCEYLRSDIVHDDQRDLATYISRLNRYSSLEAEEMLAVNTAGSNKRIAPSFRGHWTARRRALKEMVWFRLPFKPLIRLFWCLVVRRGFLDGRPGVIFAGLAAFNDWMQDVKAYELKQVKAGRRPPTSGMVSLQSSAPKPTGPRT